MAYITSHQTNGRTQVEMRGCNTLHLTCGHTCIHLNATEARVLQQQLARALAAADELRADVKRQRAEAA